MVALAARIISRSPSGLSDVTPSKRRGTLHVDETGCSPPAVDSAGAAVQEAAPARMEVAVGAADILGVGGVEGVAGAARAAGLVGVASPALSSCGSARSVSSAASWKACTHHAHTMHTPCTHHAMSTMSMFHVHVHVPCPCPCSMSHVPCPCPCPSMSTSMSIHVQVTHSLTAHLHQQRVLVRGAAELRRVEHVEAGVAVECPPRPCRPQVVHHVDELARLGTDRSDARVVDRSLRARMHMT